MPYHDDDLTPPPQMIELSKPRIIVEPTMQGLANGLVNTYEAVVANRDNIAALTGRAVTRDECAQMRTACPAAVAQRKRPSVETLRKRWALLDTRLGAALKIGALVTALATCWWTIASEVAALRASQREMKSQIVKEIRRDTPRPTDGGR